MLRRVRNRQRYYYYLVNLIIFCCRNASNDKFYHFNVRNSYELIQTFDYNNTWSREKSICISTRWKLLPVSLYSGVTQSRVVDLYVSTCRMPLPTNQRPFNYRVIFINKFVNQVYRSLYCQEHTRVKTPNRQKNLLDWSAFVSALNLL